MMRTIKTFAAGLIFLLFTGCSMSLDTALVAMDANLAAPIFGLNDQIPVFFPSQRYDNRQRMNFTRPVITTDSYQELYPEYIFNQ
ncbi:MAG: hypothetical protein KKE17_02535 [Proteobacteria bacterium]|nr:hypothetical protein [Pseudomonadota bacterium]MBU1708858.1 hypothetical protein [Pseudomonadota bacterium]